MPRQIGLPDPAPDVTPPSPCASRRTTTGTTRTRATPCSSSRATASRCPRCAASRPRRRRRQVAGARPLPRQVAGAVEEPGEGEVAGARSPRRRRQPATRRTPTCANMGRAPVREGSHLGSPLCRSRWWRAATTPASRTARRWRCPRRVDSGDHVTPQRPRIPPSQVAMSEKDRAVLKTVAEMAARPLRVLAMAIKEDVGPLTRPTTGRRTRRRSC